MSREKASLKEAQHLAQEAVKRYPSLFTNKELGVLISLFYGSPGASVEDMEGLVRNLGIEGMQALARYRKRKNYPFAGMQPLSDARAVRRELEGLVEHFGDSLELPSVEKEQLQALGMGKFWLFRKSRWRCHETSVENLPQLLGADTLAWEDLKHGKGGGFAFVVDSETQVTGVRRVRLASTKQEALRILQSSGV